MRDKIYCEQVQIKIEIKEISYENVGPGPKVIQKDNTMKKTDYLISFLTINHYEIQRDKKSIINMFNPTVYKDSVISQDKMKRNYKMKMIAEITRNSSTNKNDHEQNYEKNPISPVNYTVIVRYKLTGYSFIFSRDQKRCPLTELILNRVYKIDPSGAIAHRYISHVFLTLGPQGTQARTTENLVDVVFLPQFIVTQQTKTVVVIMNVKMEDSIRYAANNTDIQRAEERYKTTVFQAAKNSPRQREMLKVIRELRDDQDIQHKVMKPINNYSDNE